MKTKRYQENGEYFDSEGLILAREVKVDKTWIDTGNIDDMVGWKVQKGVFSRLQTGEHHVPNILYSYDIASILEGRIVEVFEVTYKHDTSFLKFNIPIRHGARVFEVYAWRILNLSPSGTDIPAVEWMEGYNKNLMKRNVSLPSILVN